MKTPRQSSTCSCGIPIKACVYPKCKPEGKDSFSIILVRGISKLFKKGK